MLASIFILLILTILSAWLNHRKLAIFFFVVMLVMSAILFYHHVSGHLTIHL